MFYSQFILAKKGPLGTIWIAAHLERKLRKNQVADTDIGVSVDSILFPEVPIALRLSSHLLLGVVRIYSRKVNYLFNDCSETLVKIKQAFRSTAVDLPPEASTAPYHSITLPETFDLDDLELPESSFGQGNFVDHHVTTREQITLQDPVEDTVYLGSQFGLDERFGDGDAPQMGLDFDEDLFADRASSPGPSSAALQLEEDVLPSTHAAEGTCSKWMEIDGQQSRTPAPINSSHVDEDETRDHSTTHPLVDHSEREIDLGFPNVLPPHVVEVVHVSSKVNHAPDLNREISLYSTIQGPSTPRLTDETLTAQVGEMLASSSLQKNQIPNSSQSFVPVLHSQAVTSTSISTSGLSKRLEQVEMSRLSQRPALTSSHFEEVREVDIKIPNNEDVQPEKECLKEQPLLANTERIIKHQRSIALHAREDVNSVPITEPSQEVTMRVSKELPTVAFNSQYTTSTPTLAVPAVPLPSSHSYELDVSKQQLPVHEIQASTGSMHLADAALRAQDMSTLGFQQLYQAGDGKKQLYSTSASQGLAQVSQVHNNQQLPVHEMRASTGSMHLVDSAFRAQDMSTLGFQQLNQAGDGKRQLHSTSASQGPDQVSQVHNNQQLPVHEIQASTGSMHLADAAFRAQEMSALGFQQLNQAGDGKKQLHLTSASQGLPQISQVHNNQVSNRPVQQNPVAIPTFSTYFSGQQFNLASGLQPAVGISGSEQVTIHEPSASATVVIPTFSTGLAGHQVTSASSLQSADGVSGTQRLTINGQPASANVGQSIQEASPREIRQLDNVPQSKQQLQSSGGAQEYDQVTKMQNSMINTRVHDNVIATQSFPTSIPRQQLNLGSDYHSAVDILGSQEPSFHGFPAPVSAISNRQELSSVNNFRLLNQEADKQQLRLAATTQECAQLKETENFVVSTTAQEFNKSMQEFPSSGKHLNLPFGHHSASSMSNTHQVPPFGNSSEPAYVASQKFWSPQKTQVPETSSNMPSNGQTDGLLLHASNENLKQYQSFHVSAEAEKSPLHERQHGESAVVFPSSDIHRIPTNIPVENTYLQSSSVSVPTGVQGVSKFILDESTATQHCNFPLERGTRESYTDIHSGNTLQETSFPWQVGTFGIHADVPSRNIFQPCSSSHAERNEISANMPSRNILLQHSDFPKVTGSQVFPTSVTGSKSSVPQTSQYRTFSVASDELSNALSISQVLDVTTSKAEQFKTTQSQPEPVKRSVPEIPVHETLRSSVHIVRNEPDIFGLKRPVIGNEAHREADKNTITAKQSFGSRKRHMMDSTPVLKDVTPNSRSRLSLSSRSLDYVPHDDDVLASILGRTPSFKIKPTPAKTVAAKRPRPTPRTTGAKRKALIDIAMVIHGDVIRQQLANTEDIRRVRKKGPCTSQEIRMLQKESQAHYMFFEPSIPGLCMELHDLYSQVFGSTGAKLRQVDKDENSIETEKTQEPSSSLEPTNDSRMVQLEKARRPLETVSEIESSRVHVDSVQKSKMTMDDVYRSREHMDHDHGKQENRPLDMVTAMRSSSVRMDNVHARREQERPEGIVSAVQSSRVHKDGLHKEQQQESHQKYVSVLESGRFHMDDFQKEQHQESFQEFVSELESSRVHMYNAHQNRNQELQKIVCEPESSRVHMYDAQQNPAQESQKVICEAESSRVHVGDGYQEQEQERPLGVSAEMECVELVSGVGSSRAVTVVVHQKQDQERPREIGSEIESSRAHTADVHQKQEQEQQMPRGIIYEMESSRAHSGDVHQKQVQEQQMPRGIIYEMESNRAHSGDVHQKQVQEQQMPRGILYDIESSRAHSGDVYQKQEQEQQMPKGLTYEIESSRIHVDDVQRKQTSIASFSQNPINTITGSEVSDITKTFESSMVQQGNVFVNEVFVPQDNTFGGCQFQRPQDSSMFGACANVREEYLSNNHSPLNPSCLSENHKTSLEDKVGSSLFASNQMSPILPEKHGIAVQDGGFSQSFEFATNLRANEGGNLLPEELEITVIKNDESKYLGENRGMQMSQAKEGVDKETASEFCKIIKENELSNKEPNITKVRREQSHEIGILGQSSLDVAKEETFKNYGSQSQGLYCSAPVLTLQGKVWLQHNNDDTGERGDLTTPGNIMGASVQNFGVENPKQDEQVLMSGKLTEMSCREAEASEDVALRDREDQHGSKQVVVNTTTEEDEEFDFLGDADNTEFLVGDGDAQADYEGKGNAADTEENQVLENSGWSARTRAVSRYLKTVFESMDYSSKNLEAENRQKLSLDRLLVGKRRKEAARMFFETLVLKTRDYVDVEQKDSFGDIGLCPRAKLMKANF